MAAPRPRLRLPRLPRRALRVARRLALHGLAPLAPLRAEVVEALERAAAEVEAREALADLAWGMFRAVRTRANGAKPF